MIYNLENRIANNYLVGLNEGGFVLIDTGYVEGYANRSPQAICRNIKRTLTKSNYIRYKQNYI